MEYDPLVCEVIEAAFVKGQNTVCSSQDHVSTFFTSSSIVVHFKFSFAQDYP